MTERPDFEEEKENRDPNVPSATALDYPDEVLNHPSLSLHEKRAILAFWASDARAVPNDPTLRQLPSGAVVPVAAILRALAALDADDHQAAPTKMRLPFADRRGAILIRWRGRDMRGAQASPDDDDPPPLPAVAALPRRRPFVAAYGTRAR